MKTTALAILATLALTACQTMPGPKTTTAPNTAQPEIIDAHVHTSFSTQPDPTSHIQNTYEQFQSELKESKTRAAISLEIPPETGRHPQLNPPQIFSCVGIGNKINLKQIEAKLKDTQRYRCLKIYLGYIHKYANDPTYKPIYALAQKYDVPVIFHTGDTDSKDAKIKYADPTTVDEVAVDYPKLTIVIAHLGNPWIESAAEVAYKNPNVSVDLSGLITGELHDQNEIENYLIKPIRWAYGYVNDPKKFLYGSDWPIAKMRPYADAVRKAVPQQDWCDVFQRNAIRTFRLPIKDSCSTY